MDPNTRDARKRRLAFELRLAGASRPERRVALRAMCETCWRDRRGCRSEGCLDGAPRQ